jgi:hypothetical protein
MVNIALVLMLQTKTVNYDIFRGDDNIGEAKVLIRITQDGGKRTDTKLTLKQSGKTLEMHTTQVWAFSGRPTLKIVQFFDAKGNETIRTRIDFKPTSVQVSDTRDGKTKTSTVPIDKKDEIRDLPEFWFLRDEPVPNTPFSYFTFNATSFAWESTKSTFKGEVDKKVNGKTMKLNHVSQEIGGKHSDVWLDSEGFPVITEASNGTKIVARF